MKTCACFPDVVPAPQHLTLERQMNKSVLIGWTPPDISHQIESYHVYVDGVLKVAVKATERTRALVEGVDSTRVSWFFLLQLIHLYHCLPLCHV